MNNLSVTARDLMKTDLVTVTRNTPLGEIEQILADHGISGVPVTDAGGHIVGLVSIRDLVDFHANQEGKPALRTMFPDTIDDESEAVGFVGRTHTDATAADVMSANLFAVAMDASLVEVARQMTKHRIHRILVADNGRHVGLISSLDVLEAIARG